MVYGVILWSYSPWLTCTVILKGGVCEPETSPLTLSPYPWIMTCLGNEFLFLKTTSRINTMMIAAQQRLQLFMVVVWKPPHKVQRVSTVNQSTTWNGIRNGVSFFKCVLFTSKEVDDLFECYAVYQWCYSASNIYRTKKLQQAPKHLERQCRLIKAVTRMRCLTGSTWNNFHLIKWSWQ